MADIESGDIIRLALEYAMPEQQEAYNVLGLRASAGDCTDAQFLTAAATWVASAYNTLASIVHQNVDLHTGKAAKMVWSGTAWITDRVIGLLYPSVTFTSVVDMLPHAVAGVVTFPTVVPKRRGRIFLPGLAEDTQADSLLSTGAATAMGNFATAIRNPFTAGTATFNYAVLGILGNTNTSTGFELPGVTGTQRRRKPGVGV